MLYARNNIRDTPQYHKHTYIPFKTSPYSLFKRHRHDSREKKITMTNCGSNKTTSFTNRKESLVDPAPGDPGPQPWFLAVHGH